MASTKTKLDEQIDAATIENCLTEEGEIDVDVVAGVFYNRSKKLFKEVFEEVLQQHRQRMLDDGIPEEILEKYHVKMKIHRKKPRDPKTACKAICSSTKQPCALTRKEGYDFCGRHLKNNQKVGQSYTERTKFKGGDYQPKSPRAGEEEEASYVPKEEIVEQQTAEIEEIDGRQYLIFDYKVFYLPEDFDPEGQYDESSLELAGTKKRVTGEIQWLNSHR